MIRDLTQDGQGAGPIEADVAIVGAGMAGLTVATRLARAGLRAVVLESGGMTQDADTHPLNEVEQVGDVYDGAINGRFRCLGGTSTRWGGAMLPFQPADFATHPPGWGAKWPAQPPALAPYLDEIERLFGLPGGPYDFENLMPGAFLPRSAKWPPFRMRNVATLYGHDLGAGSGPEVWLNATAVAFGFEPSGRMASVTAKSLGGAAMTVRARQFVLTNGAIESTRLLLLADRGQGQSIFAPHGLLGRYFHDHLSARVARLTDVRAARLNRVLGFSFEGAAMRSLRFEPSAGLREASGLPAGFVHIKPTSARAGGFDALRAVFQKLQRRRPPAPGEIAALALSAPWLARAVWWRFAEKRLLFPDAAEFEVHVVSEQEPAAHNRISLSDARVDPFGLPLAKIDWTVAEGDAQNVAGIARAFAAAWKASHFADMAAIELTAPADLRQALAEGGGIYHPGGTARMGADASQGVVDAELVCFQVPNLSVVSTAVFPTGGGANPTMTLMMAGLRAADRLRGLLER